jgi:Tol biopolymer transport system component
VRTFVTARGAVAAAAIPFLAAAVSCDSSSPSEPATLVVEVTVGGAQLDPDGFALLLDGETLIDPVVSGSSISRTVEAGSVDLSFEGLAANCLVAAEPGLSPTLGEGTETTVVIDVHCLAPLQDVLLVESRAGAATSLVAMRPDGSDRRTLMATWTGGEADVAPDGLRIVYDAATAGGVTIAYADMTHARPIAPTQYTSSAHWSPAGDAIALRCGPQTGPASLCVADGSGSNLEPIYEPAAGIDHFQWSPDGQWIVFNNGDDIARIRPDGTGFRILGKGSWPAWSPAGDAIAFADQNDELALMTPDGEPIRSLGLGGALPVWSADGEWLAYWSTTTLGVALVRPDGSDQTSLPLGTGRDLELVRDWAP